MFKKTASGGGTIADDVETIVGPSVKIEGDFKSDGNIVVAGIISGKLGTAQILRVEERAKIMASVEAKDAVIAGEVQGNVHVLGHLEILSTAKINGDIKTGSISIQQGATLNGNLLMSQTKEDLRAQQKEQTQTERERTKQEWLEGHAKV